MRILTDHPIAVDSRDHTDPFGTRIDNSVNPAFNQRLYERIPAKQVRLLDIGCAGGGLVASILGDGGFAVGIEGSDYSEVHHRAEWPSLGGRNLFTADVTRRFDLLEGEPHTTGIFPALFNVVTAWEFWEHIAEDAIKAVCVNIVHRMTADAFMVGSISSTVEPHHQTCQPKRWWIEKFASCGLKHAPEIERHFWKYPVRSEGFLIGVERG